MKNKSIMFINFMKLDISYIDVTTSSHFEFRDEDDGF